ncbi:hypothetical protein Ccrd_020682, partial [Cynara cardunculus var. scolymus]
MAEAEGLARVLLLSRNNNAADFLYYLEGIDHNRSSINLRSLHHTAATENGHDTSILARALSKQLRQSFGSASSRQSGAVDVAGGVEATVVCFEVSCSGYPYHKRDPNQTKGKKHTFRSCEGLLWGVLEAKTQLGDVEKGESGLVRDERQKKKAASSRRLNQRVTIRVLQGVDSGPKATIHNSRVYKRSVLSILMFLSLIVSTIDSSFPQSFHRFSTYFIQDLLIFKLLTSLLEEIQASMDLHIEVSLLSFVYNSRYGSFLLRDLHFDAIQFCVYELLRIGYKFAARRDLNDPENAAIGAFAGALTGDNDFPRCNKN